MNLKLIRFQGRASRTLALSPTLLASALRWPTVAGGHERTGQAKYTSYTYTLLYYKLYTYISIRCYIRYYIVILSFRTPFCSCRRLTSCKLRAGRRREAMPHAWSRWTDLEDVKRTMIHVEVEERCSKGLFEGDTQKPVSCSHCQHQPGCPPSCALDEDLSQNPS